MLTSKISSPNITCILNKFLLQLQVFFQFYLWWEVTSKKNSLKVGHTNKTKLEGMGYAKVL